MTERTELLIVRHGETQANLDGRWQGHGDSPLTERGTAQAQAIARRLRACSFDALYSSDLGRAHQTAQVIAERTGHAILLDPCLRERHLGIFQGLTKAGIAARYPEEWHAYRIEGPDYVIPGGESARQCFQRAIARLEAIAHSHPGQSVVVVTHGGVLNGLFRHALRLSLIQPRRFQIQNASLNVFWFERGDWTLVTWGDISHLDQRGT
jgi:probable phosphoglycerate mutase